MTPDTLGLLLVGALFVILGMCWYIVRLEDAADEEAERVAAQLARVRPPEGAVLGAQPAIGKWLDADKVWAELEAMPGFNEGMDRAVAQLDAGQRVPFEPVRHVVPRPPQGAVPPAEPTYIVQGSSATYADGGNGWIEPPTGRTQA